MVPGLNNSYKVHYFKINIDCNYQKQKKAFVYVGNHLNTVLYYCSNFIFIQSNNKNTFFS